MVSFLRRYRPAEHVATSFRWFDGKLFADTRGPSYSGQKQKGCYALQIGKGRYFAWEVASLPRSYDDFILDGDVEIDPANGHSAAGFLFRYNNEENFYAFLASNRGMYRFDLLFNNHPMPLIEWTPLPEPLPAPSGQPGQKGSVAAPSTLAFRIIAHGSHFSFYADEEWIGEIEDESLSSGAIAFAAQNFADDGGAVFRLRSISIESRPAIVERDYLRWVHYIPHPPAARLALAETLFSQESFSTAAVQMRRGLKGRTGTAREHLLLAECYLRLSIHDRALAEVEEALRLEPANTDALFERANLLYLTNRFLEARDFVAARTASGALQPSPSLWNLLGNAEYALGNWDAAADAYRHAVEMQPEMPLFRRNLARSLELGSRRDEALGAYLEAARILFRQEAYDELTRVFHRVSELDPENLEVQALNAKVMYHEGKREEALEILMRLAAAGTEDSAVPYLVGIILAEKGRREEAAEWLEKAARLEPSFPLYHFRYAETLHLLGRDPTEELTRARSLDPDDPWINNLAGLVALQSGDLESALAALGKAREKAPAELDICINMSEALGRAGKTDQALALLEACARARGEDAKLANQRGNLFARRGHFADAVKAYEEAIRADPASPVYKENCAAACLEVDMVHRAEELLASVEESHPSASVYNLLGNVAALKGEMPRAEVSYRTGLALEPGNSELETNLAMLYLERGRWQKARALALGALAHDPGHARARAVISRIRSQYETALACAACGREWWVPREVPPQPPLVIRGELPQDAPAGRCPRCGKLFCVSCASAHLKDMRFHCAECGEPLKLSGDALRYLMNEYVNRVAADPHVAAT